MKKLSWKVNDVRLRLERGGIEECVYVELEELMVLSRVLEMQ